MTSVVRPCRPTAAEWSKPDGAEVKPAPPRLAAVPADPEPEPPDAGSPTVQIAAGASTTVTEAFDRPALDRYELEEQVGTGGMSVVYAARDLQLDRRVALKVMRLDLGEPKEHELLLAEARSLAGLSHPNIVPVYDVGHDRHGRFYMAMELVRGENLRAWLDGTPRSPSAILDVLIAAGRGLASAHAMDLVHCDFKPTNVLVGEDGRVRVVDFGIARRVFRPETRTDGGETSPESKAARERPIVGTPRYMSPEQMQAEPLTPSTDQFSFCLTLYEALYGQVPFLGSTLRQKTQNILDGKVRSPPRRSLVPKKVHAAIVRGLHKDPAARWGSMDDLLRALQRGRRRRTVGALVTAGFVSSGLAAAAVLPGSDACASIREEAASVWTPERRGKVREAFESSGISNQDQEHAHVDRNLAKFADDWAASRVRACESTDGTPPERAATRTCLQRALEQFAVVVEEVAAGDAQTLLNSREAVSSLPDITLCDAPPADEHAAAPARIRDRVELLAEELATIQPLLSLHRYERVDEVTGRVLSESEQLGYAPLLAEAQFRRADLLDAQGLQNDAATLLEQAFHTAQAADRDPLAARIAVKLHLLYGYHLARPKLAERWQGLAQAAVQRLGDNAGTLQAEQIRTVGLVALRNTDYTGAQKHFKEALTLYEGLGSPAPLLQAEAQSNFGIAAFELGELDAADAAFRSALELTEHEVGRFNTRHITIINNLGNLEQMRGDHEAAHDYFRQVYETETALYGDADVRVAMSLNNMGTALMSLHKDADAIRLFERSIHAYESGDHHGADLARPVGNLGVAHTRAQNYEQAEKSLVRAIALIESELGPAQADLSIHWFNLGSVRLEQGQYERALEAMHRSLEIDERALGRKHPFVAQTLSSIAMTHVLSGQPDDARALLEEALDIFAAFEIDPVTVGYTKFQLAKLMWAEGEHDGARELVDEAETAFTDAQDVGAPQLSDLRSWKKLVSY